MIKEIDFSAVENMDPDAIRLLIDGREIDQKAAERKVAELEVKKNDKQQEMTKIRTEIILANNVVEGIKSDKKILTNKFWATKR